ncbi:MAG: hypothetical protein BWY92_00264 [Firmicutes bacterium ADurb.BinA052]|nr:MAG: hypothetical protein BWY92_00264 [Firmicutes bacterium ADurb.BinA052]
MRSLFSSAFWKAQSMTMPSSCGREGSSGSIWKSNIDRTDSSASSGWKCATAAACFHVSHAQNPEAKYDAEMEGAIPSCFRSPAALRQLPIKVMMHLTALFCSSGSSGTLASPRASSSCHRLCASSAAFSGLANTVAATACSTAASSSVKVNDDVVGSAHLPPGARSIRHGASTVYVWPSTLASTSNGYLMAKRSAPLL